MEYVNIGSAGLRVSRVGFGTGSSGFTGVNEQTRLTVKELAGLLLYAFDRGINFWDTGYSYGTYLHIREALKSVPREKVVIATKFSDSLRRSTEKKIVETLRALKTDYLDICLLHGVRNTFEAGVRSGALEAMVRAKDKGYIRMLGLSAHGIGGIEAAVDSPEIQVLFSRINWSGACMDAYQENFLSKAVAIPYVKEVARKVLPRRLVPSFSAQVESMQSSVHDQEKVKGLLTKCRTRGKTVVGMKIFGAGELTGEVPRSMRFIMSLACVDAFLLGMVSRREVDENLNIYNSIKKSAKDPTLRTA